MVSDFWIKWKSLHPSAKAPRRGSEHAAAYDVYTPNTVCVPAGQQVKIPLGIAIAFTEGWGAQVWDRSGIGIKGMIRHCGLLDPDYRGEWAIVLRNHGTEDHWFYPGDRVAQIMFVECGLAEPEQVDELPETARGSGGFGSTGR